MKLEGSLDAFSLPDVFALLAMTKKTGALRLARDGGRGVVYLTAGALTGGRSQETRQTLARRLVGAGCLTDDVLAAAVDAAVTDPDLGVVRALQQQGGINEALLHEVVVEHVRDTVFDLMRWPEGDFSFAIDEPNPDDVGITVSAEDAVAEARRRLERWEVVTAAVPSPQTVLALAPPDDETSLTREEWALVGLVDGKRTVAELVALSGRGEYAVVSLLAGLVERGLLRTTANDGVDVLLRRLALLEPVEAATPTIPAATPSPVIAPHAVVAPEIADADVDFDVDFDIDIDTAPVVEDDDPPLADVVAVADRTPVTPVRSEPFIPARRPEHAEEAATIGSGATVDGTAAVAPTTIAYIERDPTVNKSLLLRLIAGVRGL